MLNIFTSVKHFVSMCHTGSYCAALIGPNYGTLNASLSSFKLGWVA